MPPTRRPPKVQRWIDLIAALLRHHYPVSFEDLAVDVPAFCAPGKSHDALMRMFERDKDELRSLGVPIESIETVDGGPGLYRLKRESFYLPYLSIVDEYGWPTSPPQPAKRVYRQLPGFGLTADELDFIVRAAQRAEQVGDPELASAAAGARRKLAFDVVINEGVPNEVVKAEPGDDPDVLEALNGAVQRSKLATFDYHSIGRDVTARRTVEPLGVVFVSAAWYLVARDVEAAALRQFRVRRIGDVSINAKQPQTPDFMAPEGFALSAYAVSRHAWELGDADAVEAIVQFAGTRGFVAEAMKLGEPVAGSKACRRFRVRRVDPFARWLLSLAGEAHPVSPDVVVHAWRDIARRTAAVYGDVR